MKKRSINLGHIIFGVFSIGIVMKFFHLPASMLVLLVGASGVLLYVLPRLLKLWAGASPKQVTTTYVASFLLLIGVIAKMFHLPAANIALFISIAVFNVLFWTLTSKKKEIAS